MFTSCYRIIIDKFEQNYIKPRLEMAGGVCFKSCRKIVLDNLPLSTDSLEAWHASLNSNTRTSHSNMLKLIYILQKEEKIFMRLNLLKS